MKNSTNNTNNTNTQSAAELLLSNLMATVEIDNLDLQYFIENSGATTYEELFDYIQDNNGFDVDITYYSSAMEFLTKHDTSLSQSLELASECGYEVSNLNSEVLASLLASKYCKDEFEELESVITVYYKVLSELATDEEEEVN